jgi:hypothetical protein
MNPLNQIEGHIYYYNGRYLRFICWYNCVPIYETVTELWFWEQ